MKERGREVGSKEGREGIVLRLLLTTPPVAF